MEVATLLLLRFVGQGNLQGQVKKYSPLPDGMSGKVKWQDGLMHRMGRMPVVSFQK